MPFTPSQTPLAAPNLSRHHLECQLKVLADFKAYAPSKDVRARAQTLAGAWVQKIRDEGQPTMMDAFLSEYGLSTEEGLALMTLAEALLRVPDQATKDTLIADKVGEREWRTHMGKSPSMLVNWATRGLAVTSDLLEGKGWAKRIHRALEPLSTPTIRKATLAAMAQMGSQFVLGETISKAMRRGAKNRNYTHSYDMLGEAALTQQDADAYFEAYLDAIDHIAQPTEPILENDGISIKLSALHPRYDFRQSARCQEEIYPRLLALCLAAKRGNISLAIDAEEADRLDLSLEIFSALASDPALAGWNGLGLVVQGYGKRALGVLEWLRELSVHTNRHVPVRLVKGAYWDAEIKLAQVLGLPGYPVFDGKAATDQAYLCCATYLLQNCAQFFPQFATHNAFTLAAVHSQAEEMHIDPSAYEFQRLHGMGQALHDLALKSPGVRSRIYAPVGAHRDLLAYLVRRLLENGANSSFVNQLQDTSVPISTVVEDPFVLPIDPKLPLPERIFGADRRNSEGQDLSDPIALKTLLEDRDQILNAPNWSVDGDMQIFSPQSPDHVVGRIDFTPKEQVSSIAAGLSPWQVSPSARADILRTAADLYEEHTPQFMAILAREAGKTIEDAIGEVREAVDFLRYYANGAAALSNSARPAGLVGCISPWNFPLAIFSGQIAAGLAAGNAVIAKPAESTPLVANFAVKLLQRAGVPQGSLALVQGNGHDVGQALISLPNLDVVAFTGSTQTAQAINRQLARTAKPSIRFIAETGGLNAMIVDSTALLEQAVKDVIISAFASAGQRCSALRCLYVQDDIAEEFETMLVGAMSELTLGDPLNLSTDVGPVINADAKSGIDAHIEIARAENRLIHQNQGLSSGHFVPPTLLRIEKIADIRQEIFGPVLHLATFKADDLDKTLDEINATGFGLTFGLHTRLAGRADELTARIHAGNAYVNRNQIGAVVGSQPFGGEGLSGTGPKAGGPSYLGAFLHPGEDQSPKVAADLPGPTGETNALRYAPLGKVLCLGPGQGDRDAQIRLTTLAGAQPITLGKDQPIASIEALSAVVSWGNDESLRELRVELAARDGALIPLLTECEFSHRLFHERHICTDTTAAGGNASLLAGE